MMDHYQPVFDLVYSHAEPGVIIEWFTELYAISPPNVTDAQRTELVVAAVEAGHQRLVEFLVNSDQFAVDLNYKSGYASPSPLHAAVKCGRKDLVELLLQHGASVNLNSRATLKPSSQVSTAVEFALLEDKVNILALLEPSFTYDTYTLLHLACINGAVRCVDWLLSQPRHQASVNHHDCSAHKRTPLMIAVDHGLELVCLLLGYGAKANTVSPVTQRTAMHYLLSRDVAYAMAKVAHFLPSDFVDVLRALVVAGCDVSAVDSHGNTALSLLCMRPYTDLFVVNSSLVARYDEQIYRQLLLDAGNLLIDHGATAGMWSANTALDVLTLFLKFIVMRRSRAVRASYMISLGTSRDLLMLIGQRCDAIFSSSNPANTALTLVQYLSSHPDKVGSRYDSDNDDVCDNEENVVRDICHVLMLFASQSQLLASVSATVDFFLANTCANYHWILFLVRCHINLSRSVDSTLLSLNDGLTAKDRDDGDQQKRAAAQLVTDLLSRPRSLKELSRLAVLNGVEIPRRLRVIHSLDLPSKLVHYLYAISS